jgi:predicted HicB family RNase H-like nuclease
MKKTQTQWSNEYNAKTYDRITILVKKEDGGKERIAAHANGQGLSVNAYINRLIENDMAGNEKGGNE